MPACPIRLLVMVLPLCLGLSGGGAAQAETATSVDRASLRARLTLHDPASGAVIRPENGQAVRLSVELTDGVTGRAPRGLDLFAWVRRRDRGNSSCTEAARAFRATRRIPADAVDLNGTLVVALNRDASLGVIDPKLNLYSSNMIAAHKFATMPRAMAVDRAAMRVLLIADDGPGLETLDLVTGRVGRIETGVPGARSLAVGADGIIWIGDREGGLSRLSPTGKLQERVDLGGGPVRIVPRQDPQDDRIGAHTAGGALFLAEAATGRVLMRQQVGRRIADAVFLGRGTALVQIEGLGEAEIRYADAPGRVITLPVALPFERLAAGPSPRVAVAYSPGNPVLALIDVALGRVVQPIALNQATVSEVAFTDNAVFLLSHDGGFVGAIDIATVALGKPATIRHVNLGARTARPPSGAALIVPLFPAPMVMAVEPENQTGWIIGEVASSVEMPPMDTTRLRGGVPHRVAVVDRSLREVAPGRFEATWAFPPGGHELVLTTGIAGLSACLPFEVEGPGAERGIRPVRLLAEPAGPLVAGRDVTLHLALQDLKGDRVGVTELPLLVPSLRSGWRQRVMARADAQGRLSMTMRFPHPGSFALQPLAMPGGTKLASGLVVEVAPNQERTSR